MKSIVCKAYSRGLGTDTLQLAMVPSHPEGVQDLMPHDQMLLRNLETNVGLSVTTLTIADRELSHPW